MTEPNLTQTGLSMKIGGVEYHVSPLTDRDSAELDAWVRSRFIENARLSLPGDVSRAVFDMVMSLAMREAMGLSWMFDPGRRVMKTLDGWARIAWHSVRKRHPDATHEGLRAGLMDLATLKEFRLMFDRVNELEGEKRSDPPSGSPPEQRSTT